MGPIDNHRVASPTSTGEAGAFFEQHVGAFYLSVLTVRGIPPILTDTLLHEVHFQTKRLGWHTDDLLLVGMTIKGARRQLALQVKRRFTVSVHDDRSKQTITEFWNDFRHNKNFSRDVDRLALVVLKGTDVLLNDLNKLLDCARVSADGAAFREGLDTEGLLSKKSKQYENTIRTIIKEVEKQEPSDEDIRAFLAVLHVYNLDLNTATAQAEVLAKSLLAACSSAPDPTAAAATTWSELLELAAGESTGMPAAASYTYLQLPDEIRSQHSVTIDSGPLQALREHSQITIDGITTTIGGTISIPRTTLGNKLFDSVNTNQVAVITSPAGSGKSALAKMLFRQLSEDTYCLAFRAEEFAVGHIDNTLSSTTVAISAERLFAILAGHGRIAIFVESVERLLESTVRDAFSDLLRQVSKYNNLRLILTCRDYSIATIQSSLLEPNSLAHDIIEVPPLTNDELAQVAQHNENIAAALKNGRLKNLLRSPYLLNVAAGMDWSETTASSEVTEASFRQRCWREVVRKDDDATSGLNRRREQVFITLCVRRAKALRPYIQCDDLDPDGLQALIADGLITTSPSSISFGAPSHDVLEDWATIQWIENQFLAGYGSGLVLAESIARIPALRRGYRKWLGEKLLFEPETVDRYVFQSFSDASLPSYFRDDTLVCLLLSNAVDDFLRQHIAELLANNADLMIRVIHLLRVACKSTPHWLNRSVHVPSVLLQPQGHAWATVIGIVREFIEDRLPANASLILGLVEDWSGTVAWNNLTPPGFEDAGFIAHRLLPELGGYRGDSERSRALKVIAKIPSSQPEKFKNLVRRACLRNRDDDTAGEFAEILLPGMNSSFCCREYPDEIIRLTKSIFLLTAADIEKAKNDYNYSSGIDTDQYFGIRHYALNTNFHPASAMRGPFKWLLTYQPTKGAAFIVELMNHSGTWYGEQKWPYERLEKPFSITLQIPGEAEVVQWAEDRLWGLYRGLSVGPQFLESALMALEEWLLSIAAMKKVDLEAWLLYLLRNSNNIAVTAVVASVCTAHPDKAGKAALAILSSKELVRMDQARMLGDHGRPDLSQMFPDFSAENRIYREEREKSDSLGHRSQDLEALAIQLQLTDQRERVWQVIDHHREQLPSQELQTDEDRLWRLALHRIDVRGYEPMDESGQTIDAETAIEVKTVEAGRMYFGPGQVEDDVQALIDRDAPRREQHENTARLSNWGFGSWSRSSDGNYESSCWPEMLLQAQKHNSDADPDYIQGAAGLVAAVCVRDHWDEMGDTDRRWCVDKLIEEVRSECDSRDHTVQVARHAMRPDRAAAYLLPFISTVSESVVINRMELVDAIAIGITHASTEVQSYAAAGIGQFLHEKNSALLLKCAGALALQARISTDIMRAERSKPYDERLPVDEAYHPVAAEIRHAILATDIDVDAELSQIDVTEWPGQNAASLILQIFAHAPESSHAIEFHQMIAEHEVSEWKAKSAERGRRTNFEFEHACKNHVARFALNSQSDIALRVCGPIIDAAQDYPEGSADFVQSLISEEDKSSGKTTFWILWQRFAEQACSASWADKLDSKWQDGKELVGQLFLGIPWKEGVRHWRRLEGNAQRIDSLLQKLPPSSFSISAYCRFLNDIGEQSLPKAYVIIAARLTSEISLDSSCVFDLESMLSRQVYGEPLKLKSDHNVQSAVLRILDHLIEAGSSSAYRMRDDFVTPIGLSRQ